jgi:MinD-like ATPase involved in chromosome partitioning or flagellar assembly
MKSIVTFYSYKGGVGRTMAMANVAVLLAQRGLRVLAVDWDLEAPGLERYFGYFTVEQRKGGLLSLLREEHKGSRGHYREHVSRVAGGLDGSSFTLDLLPSGRESDPRYATHLERFDWEEYYRGGGGDFVESLRRRWLAEYDVTLVDSRTGLSDTGGICTIQLPDVVVAMFTANHQSLFGVRDIMRSAQDARDRLAYDRAQLRILPVPARFALDTSSKEAVEWTGRIAEALDEFYLDWIPSWARARQVTEALKVPQIDAFGFGEKLAVIEQASPQARHLTDVYRKVADLITQDQADAVATLRLVRPRQEAPRPAAPTAVSPEGYKYDVYVSHRPGTVLDEWVAALVDALRDMFLIELGTPPAVFVDFSELRIGELAPERISDSLLRSRLLLAVVTPDYVASEPCRREWATFEQREATTASGPLIVPLLLRRPTPMPEWVSRRQAFDVPQLLSGTGTYSQDFIRDPLLRLLTDVVHDIEARLRTVPQFDARWTIAQPTAKAAAEAQQAVPDLGPSELALDADAMAALLATAAGRGEVVQAAQDLVRRLQGERDFRSVIKVAAPLLSAVPGHVETTGYYAKALIETGTPDEAVTVLTPHVKRLNRKSAEFAEAIGLLGRAHKDIFLAASRRTSPAARRHLSQAIAAYRQGYGADPVRNTWHGVNLVALKALSRRRKPRGPIGQEEKALARSIVRRMRRTPESLWEPWDHATAAELYIALSDWPEFERHVAAYVADSRTDGFELAGFLRQLTEIWNLEADPERGAPIVATLRARVLNLKGGAVIVGGAAARPTSAAPVPTPALRRAFSLADLQLEGLHIALARARSVGAVRDAARGVFRGTCFLVSGWDFGLKRGDPVLLTAAYVVGRHADAALKAEQADIVFEAMDPPVTLRLGHEIWSSPPLALGAALFRMAGVPADLAPLPLSATLPSLDVPQRVYVIGHAGGHALQVAIKDNELLDHEGPPAGAPSTAGIVRVHYRAATAPGSSGSPVFDEQWQVIAIHHGAGTEVPRLNGKTGTYAANDGVWIQSIVEAVKSSR